MLERLDWDSDFFGFGVGRMLLSAAMRVGAESIKRQMEEMDLRLLYLFHNEKDLLPEEESEGFLRSAGARLVDRKVTYGKSPANGKNLQPPSDSIIPFTGSQPTQQLYTLALQSGEYSRFRLDKGFLPGTFERLYRLWMENSITGTMADKVLIAPDEQGNVLGMVTLSLKGDSASIGLIAVDENARGLKLGKKLMQSAEWYAMDAGKASIIVPTQWANKAACAFYEHLGYEVAEVIRVYHWWRK